MSRRGLPTNLRMRHDAHYVEEIVGKRPVSVGRLIALEKLDPNPHQPRVDIGDLSELINSIREKGVLEPLLVKPLHTIGRWMIIAGERRWRAAGAAELREVPCIELDVDDQAVAEIALIENMQRKDLTPWEEADGLRALCEKYGYTHEEVAKKVGKSRSSITEALSISALPLDLRNQCRRADISSKSLLLQIVRQPDEESMWRMVQKVTLQGLNRDGAREVRKQENVSRGAASSSGSSSSGERPFVFRHTAPESEYKLEVTFRRARVEVSDVCAALRAAADVLEKRTNDETRNTTLFASDNDG